MPGESGGPRSGSGTYSASARPGTATNGLASNSRQRTRASRPAGASAPARFPNAPVPHSPSDAFLGRPGVPALAVGATTRPIRTRFASPAIAGPLRQWPIAAAGEDWSLVPAVGPASRFGALIGLGDTSLSLRLADLELRMRWGPSLPFL
jgi:hypothetical protein